MTAVPRIRRAVVVEADVHRPPEAIPVIATLHWGASGLTQEVHALATAWTRDALEIPWTWEHERRTDWIEARCVKRRCP